MAGLRNTDQRLASINKVSEMKNLLPATIVGLGVLGTGCLSMQQLDHPSSPSDSKDLIPYRATGKVTTLIVASPFVLSERNQHSEWFPTWFLIGAAEVTGWVNLPRVAAYDTVMLTPKLYYLSRYNADIPFWQDYLEGKKAYSDWMLALHLTGYTDLWLQDRLKNYPLSEAQILQMIRLEINLPELAGRKELSATAANALIDRAKKPKRTVYSRTTPDEKQNWMRKILSTLATNPVTTTEVLVRLSQEKDTFIASVVAGNPRLPPDRLLALAELHHSAVDVSLARNPATPMPLLLAFSDPRKNMQEQLARNPSISKEIMMIIATGKNQYAQTALLQNPALSVEALMVLGEKDHWKNFSVLGHPNTPPQVIEMVYRKAQFAPWMFWRLKNCPASVLMSILRGRNNLSENDIDEILRHHNMTIETLMNSRQELLSPASDGYASREQAKLRVKKMDERIAVLQKSTHPSPQNTAEAPGMQEKQ